MHRHIKAGERGRTLIEGELLEGAITEVMSDDLMAFRADIGNSYTIHRHSFVPDYKTETGQNLDGNSSFAAKGGISESERSKWLSENAYFRWLNEDCPHSQDVRFWCEAERAFDALWQ